ncbi:hypothetical protein SAMN05443667_105206 [Flavobacterium gillisiae]|uniref:Uncharacterized protein n=1 Tax=Flavobacterium gillisiae TaxID=150146 RepID=A0A1H4C3V0_9FLAO|nr:hypothetical protein [Flavobacterium gillisiae]SEA54963.1 hypothetical protein SAMN05443667_105206 [Flavobacterium gillisiae]
MEQNYIIKNGEITFDENKIVIADDSKEQIRIQLFSSICWTFYGTMSVLRYIKTGDEFLLWSGLFIGIAYFLILILTLLRTSKSQIENNEVHSIALKQRFGNVFIDIKLKNNKLRRVNLIGEIPEEIKNIITKFNKAK